MINYTFYSSGKLVKIYLIEGIWVLLSALKRGTVKILFCKIVERFSSINLNI